MLQVPEEVGRVELHNGLEGLLLVLDKLKGTENREGMIVVFDGSRKRWIPYRLVQIQCEDGKPVRFYQDCINGRYNLPLPVLE